MNHSLHDYTNELLRQRTTRAEQLMADRSWLSVSGLFWLQEGENGVGADPNNPVVLVGADIPPHAGSIEMRKKGNSAELWLHVVPGVPMMHNGLPVTEQLLQHDMSPQPDFITLGTLTLLLLKRGDRYAIRLFDTANPARQTFSGLDWYPVDPALRIEADYVPHDPPRTLAIDTVIGDVSQSINPGAVHFTLVGQECRLEAEARGDKLFFNFRDLTNRDATYPAGRFLYTDVSVRGKVTLDFNQATNPYCAYTPYATCPLPPPQNQLPIRIEAGEKRYSQ
jgi:uncharacterized protein